MAEQLDLSTFSHQNGPDTEKEAAAKVAPHVNCQGGRILWALRGAGEKGLTQKEIHVVTGIERHTISPRMTEMEEKGHIAKVNEKREGCYVYLATGGGAA